MKIAAKHGLNAVPCAAKLSVVGVVLLSLVACTAPESPSAIPEKFISGAGKPNIVWISLEDMGAHIGAYGDQHADTPNMDAFAQQGVVYQNAFSTAPVCAPSRSAIITGMHAVSLGTHHMRSQGQLPNGVRILPHYLQQAGYFTTNNSKTDYNFVHNPSSWNDSSKTAHWRNRVSPDQPFFSVFNIVTSHESRVNKDAVYYKAIASLAPQRLKEPNALSLPPYYPDTPVIREAWKRYYDIITAADAEVGRILRQLDEDGLADQTVVILWSDHGAGLPRAKRWIYDSGIRVPMIIRMPPAFQTSTAPQHNAGEQLVSLVDLAPTVLNLAGVVIPQHMQGQAFLGANLNAERSHVFAARDRMDERYDAIRAVRDKHYKYIRNYDFDKPYFQYMNTPEKGVFMQELRRLADTGELPIGMAKLMAERKPKEELYDVRVDQHEVNNLAESPAHQTVLREYRKVHAEWRSRVRDSGVIPEAYLRKLETTKQSSIYDLLRDGTVELDRTYRLLDSKLARRTQHADWSESLQHRDPIMRYLTLRALAGTQQPNGDALKELVQELLSDPEPVVQIEAAGIAARNTGDLSGEAIRLLMGYLTSDDEWLRLQAALALEAAGESTKSFVEQIKLGLNDDNKYVVRIINRHLNVLLGTNNEVR